VRLSATVDTVLNYLGYLKDAFVLHEASRYDIKGKRRLEVNSKYYVGDSMSLWATSVSCDRC
jgi:uncharacterized protein